MPIPSRFVEQRELRGQAHAISLVGGQLDRPTLDHLRRHDLRADLSQLGQGDEDGVLFVQEVDDRAASASRRSGRTATSSAWSRSRRSRSATWPSSASTTCATRAGSCARSIRSSNATSRSAASSTSRRAPDHDRAGARLRVGPTPVWADCGTVEALLSTNRFLLANGRARAPAPTGDSAIIPPVNIDRRSSSSAR